MPPGVGFIDAGRGIQLAYVVDRLCSEPGDEQLLGADSCVLADPPIAKGGSSSLWRRAEQRSGVAAGGEGAGLGGALSMPVVYRISIRAFGPRGTESYLPDELLVLRELSPAAATAVARPIPTLMLQRLTL